MIRRTLLLAVLASLAATPAQAHVFPLFRANSTGNLGVFGYPSGVPKGGLAVGFTHDIADPMWFQTTIAWDSNTQSVLVGCRGHGSARVTVWLTRSGAVTSRCRDLSPWRAYLLNVGPRSRVEASVLITPEARFNADAGSWS